MASVDEKQGHGRVLEFDKVTKSFAKTDSNEITHALAEVNLTIQPGEFVSIVGTSGCGKSTILRLIAGLIRPTTGEIRLGGKPIVGAGPDRGMVFQKATLFPWLTVEKNVSFSLRMQKKQDKELVEHMLKMVGLEDFRKDYPHQLSGGMAPLFIFTLDMGTAGAALATGLSQFISFCILLWMCNHQDSCISISIRKFRPKLAIYREILYGGIPSLGRQGIASVATILMNFMCQPYGDAAIAAMSIVSRFMFFINSVIIGFGQGFQPVCSYCFGAGLYDRVKKACWFCIRVSTIILLVLSVISFPAARSIITLFRRNDPTVIEIGTLALRLQLITLPLQGAVIMGNMMPQSIGYGFRATLVSTARQGIFLIPLLTIMTYTIGLLGIQCAQPLADIATFILSLFVIRGIFKEFPEDASSFAAQ